MVSEAADRVEPAAGRFVSIRRWFAGAVRAQEGRAFLWTPIVMVFGIWTYFALEEEPALLATAVFGVAALGLLWLGRGRAWLILLAILATGFVLAKVRSDMVATPLLRSTTPEVLVTGTVTRIDKATPARWTIILAPEVIEGLPPEATPRRLRLSSATRHGTPQAGNRVAVKARLAPLPSPTHPEGFDYGRRLWFEGIGGTGRITAGITILDAAIPWGYRLDALLAILRTGIGARIHAQLDGTTAAFAEALITGERATIPPDANHSLLVSGLFHVLSISGLHMWLVAGSVFWSVRAALALSPRLAQSYPIKKWAAAAALVMGFFYLLLADSGVATERSFIMIAVVFFAVLVNRPAVSTRNLAIAAILVLLRNPEVAIDASFQMSFMAVLGLVALYEYWSGRSRERDDTSFLPRHWALRLVRATTLSVFLALVTTAVASTMSSIPAAYHFGRLAPYGLIANGLAFPVIGIAVMPMALLATLLMPFGLEALPLRIMGEGLVLVMAISDWVAGFPGAHVIVAQPPGAGVMILAAGAAAFCLLAGPARLAGVLLAAAGLALLMAGQPLPDVLIERTGANVAIRDGDGNLVPALARKARFTVGKWLQTNGEEITPSIAARRPGWTCKDNRCEARVQGRQVAFLTDAAAVSADCGSADVLIAAFPLRGACRNIPVRIDRFDLWRSGAHAITIDPDGPQIVTARGAQGKRPWVVIPQARRDKFTSPQSRRFDTFPPAPLSGMRRP